MKQELNDQIKSIAGRYKSTEFSLNSCLHHLDGQNFYMTILLYALPQGNQCGSMMPNRLGELLYSETSGYFEFVQRTNTGLTCEQLIKIADILKHLNNEMSERLPTEKPDDDN